MGKEAKKEVLKMLKKMMRDDSYGKMGEGIQKVTVMAPDKEGLKEGLSKAEEILQKRLSIMEDDEYEDEYEDEEEFEESEEEEKKSRKMRK